MSALRAFTALGEGSGEGDWANVGGAAIEAATQRIRMERAVLVETSRDDEPEGIVPREGLRANLEPDSGVLPERCVSFRLHQAQHVHRAHDAVHEGSRDGG